MELENKEEGFEVEVDHEYLKTLTERLSQGHTFAIKQILKIFTMCFNEKELKSSKFHFDINRKDVMIDVLDIFLLDTSEQIRKLNKE